MLKCYSYIPFSNFQKVFYNNNIFENKGIPQNICDILTFHNLPTNQLGIYELSGDGGGVSTSITILLKFW